MVFQKEMIVLKNVHVDFVDFVEAVSLRIAWGRDNDVSLGIV